MSKIYEVYHCKYKGEVVYIGQGEKGRHVHCNSGISHVYRLNEIHFLEGKDALEVEVVHYSTSKDVVLELEKESIKLMQPEFNSVYTNNSTRYESSVLGKEIRANLLDEKYLTTLRTKNDEDKYRRLVEEFCSYFGHKSILSGDIYLYGKCHYGSIEKLGLKGLSRFVRGDYQKEKPAHNPYRVFYEAFNEVYNIDLKDCIKSSRITVVVRDRFNGDNSDES